MKIIDLLNKIANGEELPKQIKFDNKIYTLSNLVTDYMNEDGDYLTDKFDNFDILIDEVEIIEEDKKIEKLKMVENGSVNSYALLDKNGTKCALTKHSKVMCDKINEIIEERNTMNDIRERCGLQRIEDKKIEKIIPTSLKGIDNLDEKIEIAHIDTISAIDKINEIIDHINKGDK